MLYPEHGGAGDAGAERGVCLRDDAGGLPGAGGGESLYPGYGAEVGAGAVGGGVADRGGGFRDGGGWDVAMPGDAGGFG